MPLKRGYVKYLEGFEWHLRVGRRSVATRRAYLGVVRRYLAVVNDGHPTDHDPVRRYLRARAARLAPRSMRLEISALRSWFGYLAVIDPEAWQPSSYPRPPRPAQNLVRALSDAEVGVLLAAPDLTTFVGLRDHVIMATLYQCGLRASELAALTLGDVLTDGFLYVHGKGGRDRLVPYSGAWRGLLDTYLRQRVTVRPGKRAALFVTRHGKGLRDGRSVWVIVNRYARGALGLGCGYSRLEAHSSGRPWQGHYPHLLRASFATELMNRGVDLFAIAQLLGHADASTTARYLGVDIETLKRAAACHPRASRVSS